MKPLLVHKFLLLNEVFTVSVSCTEMLLLVNSDVATFILALG